MEVRFPFICVPFAEGASEGRNPFEHEKTGRISNAIEIEIPFMLRFRLSSLTDASNSGSWTPDTPKDCHPICRIQHFIVQRARKQDAVWKISSNNVDFSYSVFAVA